MDRILIKNIRLYGNCGVSEEERKVGGLFQIDAEAFWEPTGKPLNDDISSAVDYTKLYRCIKESFTSSSYKLIESAAINIAESVLNNFEIIEQVKIRLRKNPPFDASLDYVEIEVIRGRK